MKLCVNKLALASATWLLAAMFTAPARADSVHVGNPFTNGHTFSFNGTNLKDSAGNFQNSSITTGSLTQATNALYCIDIFHNVAPPISYTATINQTGNVNYQPAGVGINNHANGDADKIGYLMYNMANNANHAIGSGIYAGVASASAKQQQWALQAALWHYTYAHYNPGNGVAPGPNLNGYVFQAQDATTQKLYNDFIYAANHSNVANDRTLVYWVNPTTGKTLDQAQVALVGGHSGAVPEPSSLILLGLGGLGMVVGAYRRRRAATV